MNKDTNNYPFPKSKNLNLSCLTLFNLSGLGNKEVEMKFTTQKTSNDGGLLLLREVEKHVGLISGLANCINDERHQSYIEHNIKSMLSQRVMQIAADYEEVNDCYVLKDDEK